MVPLQFSTKGTNLIWQNLRMSFSSIGLMVKWNHTIENFVSDCLIKLGLTLCLIWDYLLVLA